MNSQPRPRLGEIWVVAFDPVVGHEQSGVRPGLVVSNDVFNRIPHTVCLLAPLTRTDRGIPLHMPIDPPEGGLRERSFILCEHVKSLSVTRLQRRLGRVDQATVENVQTIIKMFFD